jgi:hypothetical protein
VVERIESGKHVLGWCQLYVNTVHFNLVVLSLKKKDAQKEDGTA